MKHILLLLLLVSGLVLADDEEELHLPIGFELADFDEEDFEVSLPVMHKSLINPKQHSEDESASLATLEGAPISTIANCVNVISGEFFDSAVDLVIPGPHPLIVQRTYNSTEKKWHFSHLPKLETVYSKHKIVLGGYQDGFGSGMSYQNYKSDIKKENSFLHVNSEVFDKGITNCCSGELSGLTNWKNSKVIYIKKDDTKYYAVQHPNKTLRVFKRYKNDQTYRKGAPLGKFCIDFEESLNGTRIDYGYKPVPEIPLFEFKPELQLIESKSSTGDSFGKINVETKNGEFLWNGSNGSVSYRIADHKKFIFSSTPTNAIPISYRYNENGKLYIKNFPDGRFLKVSYYKYDPQKGRVAYLLAPVGNDETPVIIYKFVYDFKKPICTTKVYDASNHLTEYSYNKKTKRLTDITHYDQNLNVVSNDRYFWSSHYGNLLSRVFYDASKPVFCRNFIYDNYCNILQDTLWGNLTGTSSVLLTVDIKGIPLSNGCESYSKKSIYSRNGFNQLLKEEDLRKWIKYSYYKDSKLLQLKLSGSDDTIFKREYYEYDQNGVLIAELYDDGCSKDINDLTGVTERHLKTIIPTASLPFGLPGIIEERYLDAGDYKLLKKTENSYSPQGKILSQHIYGSDDSLAYTLEWEYDHLGNITKEVNAIGEVVIYQYDANGNKIYENKAGVIKTFTYDFANRLIKEDETWEDGTHFTTQHQYNTLSQRVATIDSYGNKTQFTYDASGHLIKTELSTGDEIKTAYNAMGNAIKKWDANGYCTQTEFTIRGQPYRIEHPDGSIERNEYTLDGLLQRTIAKDGLSTAFTYDAQARLTHTEIGHHLKSTSSIYNSFHLISETDEVGLTTTYEYDAAGRRICQQKGDQLTRYEYDVLGRISKIIENEARVILKKYDVLDRIVEERMEDIYGTLFKKETFKYDCRGNKIETTVDKSTTYKKYNPHSEITSVIDPMGNEVHVHYDYDYIYQGQTVKKVTTVDPLGNQEIKIYDTIQRLIALMRCNAFGKPLQHETYTYDADGRRLFLHAHVYADKQFQHTITSAWEYDSMGNVIKFTEAVGTPDQKTTHTQYNSFGQKEIVLTPKGVFIYHKYNALGLLSEYSSSDNKLHYSYTYDFKDHPIQVADHIQGTTNTRSYDLHGRLITETLDTGLTTSYVYDNFNRPVTIKLPDESSIAYNYDSLFLRSIDRIKHGQIVYSHAYTDYDLIGNPLSEKLIGDAGTITYEYDLLQRTIRTAAPHWEEIIPSNGFDAVGNLLHRQVIDDEGSLDYWYNYDELYQLTSEKGTEDHTYDHDSIYNRIAKDNQIYALNDLNQLLKENDAHYEYDSNGNLIRKTKGGHVTYYGYDPLDRLVEVTDSLQTTQYIYDSFHRRLAKVQGNNVTQYLYNGQNEIGAAYNNQITELRVLGLTRGAEIGAAIALEIDNTVYAPIHDPTGNIVALIDINGHPAATYRYTAFGEKTFSNLDIPWGYSSKRYDPETGFINFGRRYYAPEIGRFITADPAGYVDGPNLYAYVHNHPLAYIDPDGRFFFLLAPMVVSMAIDYIAPAATAYLVEAAAGSAIGTAVAGAVIGVVKGYNGDYFDACAMPGTAGYYTEIVGRVVGGACSLGSPKAIVKGGSQVLRMGTKELVTNVAEKAVLEGSDQARKSITQQAAKKAKDGLSFTYKNSAAKHFKDVANKGQNIGRLERPFMRSPLLIQEIINTGKCIPDKSAINAMKFEVPGTFRGSNGLWDLVVDVENKIIYHFNFSSKAL